MKPVILASSSARRSQLLKALGFEVTVIAPNVDESPLAGEHPRDMVMRLARLKANAVKIDHDLPIIAADTIVCLDEIVLGKPINDEDAARMLSLLSGKTHAVMTGYAVKTKTQEIVDSEITYVSFRHLTTEEILAYVKTGEPRDKSGSYGIQNLGGVLIDQVRGSYTSVMGLPLKEILKALEQVST